MLKPTSRIWKPGEARREAFVASVVRNVVAIAVASAALGVAIAQGISEGDAAALLDFWSAATPIAAMTLLSVEVLKRRAEGLFVGAAGTALSLAVGLSWGLLFHFSPSFRMFDSLADSIVYGLVSGVIASGFYDVVLSRVYSALGRVGQPEVIRTVVMESKPATETVAGETPDEFAARVAARDQKESA